MKVYVYVRLLSSFNEFLLKARPVLCMGLHSVLPPLKVTLKVNFLKKTQGFGFFLYKTEINDLSKVT